MQPNNTGGSFGIEPTRSANVVNFSMGSSATLWKALRLPMAGSSQARFVITPINSFYNTLYIPGDVFINGDLSFPSDQRLKTNIKEIPQTMTELLASITCIQFTKRDNEHNVDVKNHFGFVAQELEEKFPSIQLVTTHPVTGYKSVNYIEMVPLMMKRIQELGDEVKQLKDEIREFMGKT